MKHVFAVILLVLTTLGLNAQDKSRKYVTEGNAWYKKNEYQEAVKSYEKAQKLSPNNKKAAYNLGNAYYRTGAYDSSASAYEKALEGMKSKPQRSETNYNLGNSHLQSKKYQESIEAYKKALRDNPKDEDARYNLAYAQKKLQEQQKQNNNNKNNQDNKDKQNQPQDNKDQDKKEQDNKNQDKKDQDQKDNKQDQPQQARPQPDKLSKEQAEQLLDALNSSEKKLQDKLKKKESAVGRSNKDW